MKTALLVLLAVVTSVSLSGCEDGSNLLDQETDVAPLIPEPPPEEDPNAPRPPASAEVITTTDHEIIDTSGQPVLLRGANLLYADNRATALPGIRPLKAAGSNVVRLQLGPNISADNLELALEGIVNNNMIAMLVYDDPENIACKDDDAALLAVVEDYWLGEWLPVLAQERFQPYIMINIASKWGVMNVWNTSSTSYDGFVGVYRSMVGRIREAGFRVPLVIDAPNCGQDYNAFLGNRGRSLMVTDPERNIVFSVHAFGGRWNSNAKVVDATNLLYHERLPFIFGEFGGSGYGGDDAIDHLGLMAKGAGDQALVLDLPWTGAEDKAAYVHNLETPISLVGTTVAVDVYVPEQYITDGNLNIELYVKDGDYSFASFAAESASKMKGDAWNRLTYDVSGASSFQGYVADGFDPAVIRQIGFQVAANGKPLEVMGDLKFDNLTVALGGTPPPEYEIAFDAGVGNWYRGYGDELAGDGLTVVDGNLSFAPVWTTAEGKIGLRVDGANFAIDFTQELFFKLRVFIPAYFETETGVAIKFFVHFKSDWSGWGTTNELYFDALTPGEWNDLTFTATNVTNGETPVQAFGFEIGGISAGAGDGTPILVDSIVVGTSEQLYPPTDIVFSSYFDAGVEGWSNSNWSNITEGVNHVDGTLQFDPNWANGPQYAVGTQAIAGANNLDLTTDITIKADIFLPVDTVADGFYFKFFIQDGDSWTNADSETLALEAFTLGEWTTVELAMPAGNYSAEFDRTIAPNLLGMVFGGISATPGGIRVDNVEVIGAAVDDSAEVIFGVDFDTEAEFNSFAFDFGGGGLDASSLSMAKQHELGVQPFGWVASSWHGSLGDKSVLDMSLIPGFVEGTAESETPVMDLTERGAEIILGPNGINATAAPANFPAE